jgi:hypothetical protein
MITADLGIEQGLETLRLQDLSMPSPTNAEAGHGMREKVEIAANKINRTPAPKQVVIDTSDIMIRLTPDNIAFVTAHQGLLTSGSDYFAGCFRGDSYGFKDKYVYGAPIADRTINFKDGPNDNKPSLDVLKAFT